MKYILLIILFVSCVCCQAQSIKPKLEVYAAPGLFSEQLSSDSLVPSEKRNHSRLGNVSSYAVDAAIPLKNKRWLVKGGIGLSQRHYSINKYSLGDFFIALFSFDSPPNRDSFNLSYVQFTNNYLQMPFSFSYLINKPHYAFHIYTGLNVRADFLTKSKADVTFDSTYKIPNTADIISAQKTYTANTVKFVFTAEPYIEGSFKVYKNAGLFLQFIPFSFYSSRLDKRLTTSTSELFSFTFGASYSLNK